MSDSDLLPPRVEPNVKKLGIRQETGVGAAAKWTPFPEGTS
jgi:hypothetical protein